MISAYRDNRGSLSGSAVGILVLLTVLMLVTLLLSTLQGQTEDKISSLEDTNATATYNHIIATGWSSVDLMSLIPYVFCFLVILGLLLGLSQS